MNIYFEKYFNRVYVIVCFLVFVVVCLRAFFIPLSHDEASTFFFYVQSDNYLPYRAHVYTNNHVLNSALANICYHLAGSHRFVLRIPNVLAFIVMCFGVFRFFKFLRHTSSKVILTCFFILTFNLLDFFELCRGYGLSIAFMVLALSHLQQYFCDKNFRSLLWFSICWQLALCANLTLVVPTLYLFAFGFIFQVKNKLVFDKKNIALQLVNIYLLAFWVKFSFFYKSKGVLDSGMGDDYWQVTFKSLLLFIFGTHAAWIQVLLVVLFLVMLIVALYRLVKKPFSLDLAFEPRFFYLVMLAILLVSIYFQKKLLDINYPEDRTGLFLYIFFILALVVFFDSVSRFISLAASTLLLVSSLVYFFISFNLQSFTHYFYHIVPKEFYTILENEYKKNQEVFTIGGHPNREMNYAFFNYRAGGVLNPMDEPTEMHMNCDYYIALTCEKPYYADFYEELAFDRRWGRVLLKRKQEIKRTNITDLTRGSRYFTGNDEFFEFLKFNDSTSLTKNCIEADIEIYFKKVPKPFKAFLVLQVEDEKGNSVCYKRALLNWLVDDLSGITKRIKLTSVPLTPRGKKIVVYLWNIDKKDCQIELKQLKILNLNAPGITVVIPGSYYPFIKEVIHEELL